MTSLLELTSQGGCGHPNAFAFNALSRRLKVIGIDIASLAAAAA